MRKFSIESVIDMEEMICGQCGAFFALPAFLVAEKRKRGGNFYCPNGHERVFAETENDRLRTRNRLLLGEKMELQAGLRKANREIKKFQKPKKKKKPKEAK